MIRDHAKNCGSNIGKRKYHIDQGSCNIDIIKRRKKMLTAFYQKYGPSKVSLVDRFVEEIPWEEICRKLQAKHGKTPVKRKEFKILTPGYTPEHFVQGTADRSASLPRNSPPTTARPQAIASSHRQTTASAHDRLDEFRDLMLQGLEVWLCHPDGRGNKKKVMFMDKHFKTLVIGDGKATTQNSVLCSVGNIRKVKPHDTDKTRFLVEDIRGSVQRVIELQGPSPQSRDFIVGKLSNLIQVQQQLLQQRFHMSQNQNQQLHMQQPHPNGGVATL
jgi:hypothetical protein